MGATGSPSEHAGGGLLKVGDAILAVGSTSVRPPKNTVKEVEKLILQHSQTSLTVDLIILKGWQAAEAASAASNSGGGDPGGGDPGGEEAAKGKNRAGMSSSSSDDGGQGAREREQQKRRDNSKTTTRTTRISPQQTWRYQTSLERNITSGFGLQLRKKNQLVIIDAVQKNTPAWRTHLLSPEDKIEAINGKYVYSMTLDQVISLLRSNIKVDLIVIAGGTSGSSRHSYLNVQLRPKKTRISWNEY